MRAATTFRRLLMTSALALAACSQGSEVASPGASDPGTPPGGGGGGGGGATTIPLTGSILQDTTLQAGAIYEIEGRLDIGGDIGPLAAGGGTLSPAGLSPAAGTSVTLTIPAGTVIVGESGADHIVVNRGSRIVAEGTESNPIVFTSKQDLARQADSDPSNDAGGDAIGEWGGLVILGQAPINRCRTAAVPGTSDCDNIVEGVTNPEAVYGGSDPFDDSGILRYVQVRFAGFPLSSGNELNGITFGGVGRNTIVDHVQVHNNADDGVEFFGGTVNVKHLVLTGNDDDSIDTDNGYQGNIQFVVVAQRANGGDNIVEASSASPGATPLSNATVSNFTFVGRSGGGVGLRMNTGTVGRYFNGVIDHPGTCLRWDNSAGDGVAGYIAADDPNFSSVLFDCPTLFRPADADTDGVAPNDAVADDPNNLVGQSSLASRFFPGVNETAVTAFDLNTLGQPFFTPVDYIGAFSPDENETNNWAAGWTFHLFPPAACPSGTTETTEPALGERVCSVSGTITSDVRLTRGRLYRIDGRVDVGVDRGPAGTAGDAGSLTIESGVTLYGDEGDDHIVVNRGSQIFSNGTETDPVIFTSLNDVTGTQVDPTNAIGEWGGLVILGRAPQTRCRTAVTPGSADCDALVEGVTNPDALYGGADEDDDSGVIRYTQVRYAGNQLSAGNELNGITFAGVGRNTIVDFVQVHNNADDGVEFFGGTVNVKHLVLTGNDDDSIDTDNGYQGNIQFAIVRQRSASGDNVVEASSVGAGITPLSDATVSNFTFVGRSGGGVGVRMNTGTVGHYVNGVIDHPGTCLRWDNSAGDGVAGYIAADDPNFSSVLFDCPTLFRPADADTDGVAPNDAVADDPNNLVGASSLTNTFINGSTEAGVTVVDVTALDPLFFTPVDYVGAVRDSSDRWWADWSCGLEAGSSC